MGCLGGRQKRTVKELSKRDMHQDPDPDPDTCIKTHCPDRCKLGRHQLDTVLQCLFSLKQRCLSYITEHIPNPGTRIP